MATVEVTGSDFLRLCSVQKWGSLARMVVISPKNAGDLVMFKKNSYEPLEFGSLFADAFFHLLAVEAKSLP